MNKINNVYLIFPYEHKGKKYVEAYPLHHEIRELLTVAPVYRLLTTKRSRNQARKYAYKLWIHPTGKGFPSNLEVDYAYANKLSLYVPHYPLLCMRTGLIP